MCCYYTQNRFMTNTFLGHIIIIYKYIYNFSELPDVESTDDEDGDSLGDLVEDNPTLMGIYAPILMAYFN